MNHRHRLLVIAFLISWLPAVAQWREGGKVVPDTAWSKSDGEFGATLTFTVQPDEFFAAWEKSTPGVHLSETSTATRGLPIVSIIYFTGCMANAHGNCDLVGRITTTAPDGKPYGNPFDAKVWVDKPPPDKNMLQLSQDYLGIVIDPDDQLGKYVVKVELLDRASQKKMTLEREFTAVEAPKKP